MRYIIEKEDLYLKMEESIVIALGHIVEITLPVNRYPSIIGRVIAIGMDFLEIDHSAQYESKVSKFKFKDIQILKIIC